MNTTNGYVYLEQPDPLVLITLTEPYVVPPNFPPTFELSGLENLAVNVTILPGPEPNIHVVEMPPVQDAYSDEQHTITIGDVPSWMNWMRVDKKERKLYIDANEFPREKLGIQTFDMKLCDDSDMCTSYLLSIEFYEYLWEAP